MKAKLIFLCICFLIFQISFSFGINTLGPSIYHSMNEAHYRDDSNYIEKTAYFVAAYENEELHLGRLVFRVSGIRVNMILRGNNYPFVFDQSRMYDIMHATSLYVTYVKSALVEDGWYELVAIRTDHEHIQPFYVGTTNLIHYARDNKRISVNDSIITLTTAGVTLLFSILLFIAYIKGQKKKLVEDTI